MLVAKASAGGSVMLPASSPETVTKFILHTTRAKRPTARIGITVTHSPEPSRVGDEVVFSYSLHNAGPATATYPRVEDHLPDNFEFNQSTRAGVNPAAWREIARAAAGPSTAAAPPASATAINTGARYANAVLP